MKENEGNWWKWYNKGNDQILITEIRNECICLIQWKWYKWYMKEYSIESSILFNKERIMMKKKNESVIENAWNGEKAKSWK